MTDIALSLIRMWSGCLLCVYRLSFMCFYRLSFYALPFLSQLFIFLYFSIYFISPSYVASDRDCTQLLFCSNSIVTWRVNDVTPLDMRGDFFSLCAVKLLLRPRWKEHRDSPAVSFHILHDSSLMLLSEINRAFNSHSSGSCASNYATYTLKHSKWPGSHGITLSIFLTRKMPQTEEQRGNAGLFFF